MSTTHLNNAIQYKYNTNTIFTTSILDIDECATETDECRPNGNCTNTTPHYYCTCDKQYKAVASERKCEGTYYCIRFM